MPNEYIPQITSQLACTRREWCAFVSLPEGLQIIIIRVYAKDLDIKGLEENVRQFNKQINAAI